MRTWEIGVQKYKKRTYVYESAGVLAQNTPAIVIGDDCMIALDSTAHAYQSAEFLANVRSVESKKPLKYLFITHHHGDHHEGHFGFGDPVIVCTDRLEKIFRGMYDREPKPLEWQKEMMRCGDRIPRPDITFSDRAAIDIGGCCVELIDFGHAHTPDDAIAYVKKEGIVACGDLFYNYVLPDGNQCILTNWVKAMDEILKLDADTYIPGHGPVGTKEELIVCRDYLARLDDTAKECVRKGSSLRETILSFDMGGMDDWLEPGRLAYLMDAGWRYHSGLDTVKYLPDWEVNECADELRMRHGLSRSKLYIPTKEYPYFRRNEIV